MKETIATFGKNRSLNGIVTYPKNGPGADLPAVILLNSGILHRVGPHRLYVKIGRALAAQGFLVLRFAFSGIGDSLSSDDDISVDERTVNELDEAMTYLGSENPSGKFVLMGICSGAEIAYKAQLNDSRVVGTVPINSRKLLDITDDKLASAVRNRFEARYMLQSSLFNPGSWLKLITGRADHRGILRKLKFLLGKIFATAKEEYPDAQRIRSDIRSITDRGADLLLIYASRDWGLEYIRETLGRDTSDWHDSGRFRIEVIKADHTFTLHSSQRELIDLIVNWLRSAFMKTEPNPTDEEQQAV
jgi:hypothetical protein